MTRAGCCPHSRGHLHVLLYLGQHHPGTRLTQENYGTQAGKWLTREAFGWTERPGQCTPLAVEAAHTGEGTLTSVAEDADASQVHRGGGQLDPWCPRTVGWAVSAPGNFLTLTH
jgi:hypothetical protein